MDSPEVQLERPGETQKRGQATEALLKAAFVVRDRPALVPEYDNESDDFVVESGGSFHNPILVEAYLVDISSAARGKMEIWYREPANNQSATRNVRAPFRSK